MHSIPVIQNMIIIINLYLHYYFYIHLNLEHIMIRQGKPEPYQPYCRFSAHYLYSKPSLGGDQAECKETCKCKT